MKKLLFPFFMSGLIFSCSTKDKAQSRDELVQSNAEAYLMSKINDPKSYEFVSIELVDSVLYKDNIAYDREKLRRGIENGQEYSALMLEFKRDDPSLYKEKDYQELVASNNKDIKTLSAIDSLETALGERKKEVASYTYLYKFRNTNGFGAKVLNESTIQTTNAPEYKVLHLVMDKENLLKNPNSYPGYNEVIEKHLQ